MRLRTIPGSIEITAGTKLILRDLDERTTLLEEAMNEAKEG